MKADLFSTTGPSQGRRSPRPIACCAMLKVSCARPLRWQTYSRRTGLQLGGGLTEANTGDFFVRLKPLPRRDIEA